MPKAYGTEDFIDMARKSMGLPNNQPPDEEQETEQTAEATEQTQQPTETTESSPEQPFSLKGYFEKTYNVKLDEKLRDEDLAPRIGKALEENELLRKKLAEVEKMREEQLGEYLQSYPEFSEFRKAKAAKDSAASQEVQQPKKSQWKPLEYDKEWEVAAQYDDEAGRFVPKTKYGTFGVEAAENLNRYMREQTERARRLTSDPWSLVREAGAEEYLEQMKRELLESQQKLRDELRNEMLGTMEYTKTADSITNEIEKWANERKKDLFVLDSNGEPISQPDGRWTLTDNGKLYAKAYEKAQSHYGLQDPLRAHEYAAEIYERDVAKAAKATEKEKEKPKAPEKTAKEKNVEQKKKFLEKGFTPTNRITNADGTLGTAKTNGTTQNRFLSFREAVLTDPDNAELLGEHFKG